jgi:hypothetical protein
MRQLLPNAAEQLHFFEASFSPAFDGVIAPSNENVVERLFRLFSTEASGSKAAGMRQRGANACGVANSIAGRHG